MTTAKKITIATGYTPESVYYAGREQIRVKVTGTFGGATVTLADYQDTDAPDGVNDTGFVAAHSFTSADGITYDIGGGTPYIITASDITGSTDITVMITAKVNENS